jgi:hypothetical protein
VSDTFLPRVVVIRQVHSETGRATETETQPCTAVCRRDTRPSLKQARAPSTAERRLDGSSRTDWPASAGGQLKRQQRPALSGLPSATRTLAVVIRT